MTQRQIEYLVITSVISLPVYLLIDTFIGHCL